MAANEYAWTNNCKSCLRWEAVSYKKHSRVVGATLFAPSDSRAGWSDSDLFLLSRNLPISVCFHLHFNRNN